MHNQTLPASYIRKSPFKNNPNEDIQNDSTDVVIINDSQNESRINIEYLVNSKTCTRDNKLDLRANPELKTHQSNLYTTNSLVKHELNKKFEYAHDRVLKTYNHSPVNSKTVLNPSK